MPSAPPRSAARDGIVVFACLVCQIGMGAGGYLFPVFLKPIAADLDWSRTAYALAQPIMSTSVALVGPLVGWLSDRRGPRWVLVFGGALMGAALLGAGRMESRLEFYAVAVAIGVAVSCLGDLPTASAIAGRFATAGGLALGLVYIGSNVGGAAGVFAAARLSAEGSWRDALSVIGVALWVLLLPFALLVGRAPAPRDAEGGTAAGPARGEAGPGGGAATGRGAEDVARGSATVPHVDTADALRQRDFWLLFWALFAFYLYRLGVNAHLVAYLSDLGYSQGEAALGFGLTVGLGVVGKLCAGALADGYGVRRVVLGNFALIALASALLLMPSLPYSVPAFLLVHGVSTAAEDVVIPLLIGLRFGARNLARLYGVLLLALVPGGALGPLIAGGTFDATGSYAAIFALFFVTNVSALLALAAVSVPGVTSSRRPGWRSAT